MMIWTQTVQTLLEMCEQTADAGRLTQACTPPNLNFYIILFGKMFLILRQFDLCG